MNNVCRRKYQKDDIVLHQNDGANINNNNLVNLNPPCKPRNSSSAFNVTAAIFDYSPMSSSLQNIFLSGGLYRCLKALFAMFFTPAIIEHRFRLLLGFSSPLLGFSTHGLLLLAFNQPFLHREIKKMTIDSACGIIRRYVISCVISGFAGVGYSSVAEHPTADRAVPGSTPGAPCCYKNC
jgi:hypothetical protein